MDEHRRLVGEVPACCAWRQQGDAPCRISRKDERPRTTGPCFPLSVVYCATHDVHFTLYPPGHVPHGRQPVVSLAPDGSVPLAPRSVEQEEIPAPLDGTVFEAAWDAGHKRIWSRECYQETGQWLATQVQRVEQTARLAGVNTDLEVATSIAQSEALGVDVLTLREAQAMVRQKPGLISRGAAVIHVLKTCIRRGGHLVQRLIAAGHLAGLWGRPYWWIPSASRLVPLVAT